MAVDQIDEDRYHEYDSHERVSSVDIQAIKNTIVFNMSGRELLLTTIAIIITVGILYVIKRTVGLKNTYLILVPLPFAVPFLVFAFYKPLDMKLEDWLQIWYSNNIKSMPVRKLFSENAYEKALRAAEQAERKSRAPAAKKEKRAEETTKNKDQKEKKNRYTLVQ